MFQFLSGGICLRMIAAVMICTALLCGCAAEETYETIADEMVLPVMARPREISVDLPGNAVAPVFNGEGAQLYLSDGYEMILETVASGDLRATIRTISGYEKEKLTVLETMEGDIRRYEFVWTSAGETGDRLGRAVVLDDGRYHYCMSVLRDAEGEKKSQIVWDEVFGSFSLV